MPRYRVSVPKVKDFHAKLDVHVRDHGVCVDCPTEPPVPTPDHPIPEPIYHSPAETLAIFKNPDPASPEFAVDTSTDPPTPPAHSFDDIDNMITVCKTHFERRQYPKRPKGAAKYEPHVKHDDYKPSDVRPVSIVVSKSIHAQMAAQAHQEGITISQLYRRIVDTAFPIYLEEHAPGIPYRPPPPPKGSHRPHFATESERRAHSPSHHVSAAIPALDNNSNPYAHPATPVDDDFDFQIRKRRSTTVFNVGEYEEVDF